MNGLIKSAIFWAKAILPAVAFYFLFDLSSRIPNRIVARLGMILCGLGFIACILSALNLLVR